MQKHQGWKRTEECRVPVHSASSRGVYDKAAAVCIRLSTSGSESHQLCCHRWSHICKQVFGTPASAAAREHIIVTNLPPAWTAPLFSQCPLHQSQIYSIIMRHYYVAYLALMDLKAQMMPSLTPSCGCCGRRCGQSAPDGLL